MTELSVGAVNFLVRLAKSAATNQLTVLEDLGEQIPVTGEPTSTSADGIGPVAIQSAATGDDGENVAAAGGGVRFSSSQQPQPAQSQTSAPTSLSTKERGQSAVAGAGGSGGSTLTEQAAGESVHNCQLTWEGIQNIICVVPEAVRIPWEHPPYYQVFVFHLRMWPRCHSSHFNSSCHSANFTPNAQVLPSYFVFVFTTADDL